MRRTILFRPLALYLALLMLPPEWGPLNPATPAKAATFAAQPGCAVQGGTWIIQQVCEPNSTTPPSSSTISAIQQWEQDSITQFLQLYQLPSTSADVNFVYQYARADLRSAIRGFMQTRMWVMALEDPSQLTANEATVLNWFQARWTYHEQNLYTNAIANYNSWVKNPCTWKPDSDIAQAVKLNYIACVGSIATNNAPNTDYYLLAGRKSEYESLLADLVPLAPSSSYSSLRPRRKNAAPETSTRTQATTPGPTPAGITLFTVNTDQMNAAIGTASAVAAVGATALPVVWNVPALAKIFFPFSKGMGKAVYMKEAGADIEQNVSKITNAADNSGDDVVATEAEQVASDESSELEAEAEIESETALEAGAESAPETFGIGLIVAAVVLVVTLAVTFAVTDVDAVKQVSQQLQSAQQQAFLSNGQVNMSTLLQSTEGLYKYGVVWTEATYPDVPSSSPLPAASSSTQFIATQYGQTQPVLGATYQDWSGNSWTMGYYNGYFLNKGSKNVTVSGTTTPITYDAITPVIHFTDWNNNQFTAAIVGTNFIVTKRDPATTDSFCSPNATTGLSSTVNYFSCTVQVVQQIELIDGNGNQATVQLGTAPVFSLPAGTTFSNTAPESSAAVTATGIPTPTVGWTAGIITFDNTPEPTPAGIAFAGGNGSGQLYCCRSESLSSLVGPGTYSAVLTASNIVGTTITGFTFAVSDPSDPLGISLTSSPNTSSGFTYYGQNQTYIWKASGAGPYQFYTNLTIPGMTFTDNGNGTAQFSGTPTIGTKTCSSANTALCGVWVTNAATQTFAVDGNHAYAAFQPNINYAPSASLALSSSYFPLGQTTSYILTSQGAVTPVSYSTPCSGLPNWFTVTDNGNGTATITGSPVQGSATSLPFVIQATALGSQAAENPCATPNFTAGVNSSLNVLSGSTATFQALQPGSFTIQSNGYGGGSIVLDSTLPSGLTFTPSGTTALISGTPVAGTGGDYLIYYHLTSGSSQQVSGNYYPPPLFVTVNEAAQVNNVPTSVYMMAGVPQTFVIQPGGFPSYNNMTVTLLSAAPSVPPGLLGSGVSEISTAPGTYSLAGTVPASAAGNQYVLSYRAQNSLGGAENSTTITVVPPGDVNHDMVTNCTDYDLVKSLLNVAYTSPNYNAAADVNNDGVINVLDLAFVSANLPKGTVCH
jgi:hypothetical protein